MCREPISQGCGKNPRRLSKAIWISSCRLAAWGLGQAGNVELIKLDPSFALSSHAKEQNADLVLMGTVARSGLTGMVIGNTAARILENLECSVLAVKRDSFVSRITESEYINLAAGTRNV